MQTSASKNTFFAKYVSSWRVDLGLRSLASEWKSLLSTKYLKDDFLASLALICVSLPLSLAVALASGVRPEVGIATAIVAGIVCSLFNGAPLAVTGPTPAMAILIASLIKTHGLSGVLLIGMGCGILQILTGVTRLGRVMRFIPVPVIAGFTAGIGAIIFIGQLPRAFGLPPVSDGQILTMLSHLQEYAHHIHPHSLLISVSTIAIAQILPRTFPRLPAPLLAVGIPSLFAWQMGLGVEVIGAIPSTLPEFKLPDLSFTDWRSLLSGVFLVYCFASLETLLSATASDKLSNSKRHDPDQELIGQGLGNIAVTFLSGIPVAGVITRTALNIQAGARTRRSTIFHALGLIFIVYFFSKAVSIIPLAALAGILMSVAINMLSPAELVSIWRISRIEAVTYGITFLTIITIDLLAGVQMGVAAAIVIAALRLGQSRANLHFVDSSGPSRLQLRGPLTFLSSATIEGVRTKIEELEMAQPIIMDLSEVPYIDASAGEQLVELTLEAFAKGRKIAIKGLNTSSRQRLLQMDESGEIKKRLVLTEQDAHAVLYDIPIQSAVDRLIHGVKRFALKEGLHHEVLNHLADGQNPHTLFITCADSRINPNLLTMTDPGELFVVRNVGNLVPAYHEGPLPAEGAAIEFAVGVLKINEIVICGHIGCGAMKAAVSDLPLEDMPNLTKWISQLRSLKVALGQIDDPDEFARFSVIRQLENLKTYPMVQERLEKGEIRIHGWIYDIRHGVFEEWNIETGKFRVIADRLPKERLKAASDPKKTLH